MPEAFTLALLQMRVDGGQKERNVAHAIKLISAAAEAGARMALLPEAMNLGWTHPSAKTNADAIPEGFTFTSLRDAARLHQLYICAGMVEREAQQIFNTAVLISPTGDLLLRHRKIHELAIGHPYYRQGDCLGVCRTPLATFGVMICADATLPGNPLAQSLGWMGAEVILSPSSWAVPAEHDQTKQPYGDLWRNAYKPVARQFGLWIASVSDVGEIVAGPWKGRRCIGCSLVINADGEEVLQGPYGADAETILYVNIVPHTARRVGH